MYASPLPRLSAKTRRDIATCALLLGTAGSIHACEEGARRYDASVDDASSADGGDGSVTRDAASALDGGPDSL